jgi:spore coat polysaccharide biosynthesis predicted glycosyltransferase SpsG
MADTDVLFLIEAGGRYGLGHLMRCAVLMDALRARGGRPISALRLGERELPDWTLPSAPFITLERDDAAATSQAEAVAGAQRPGWVVVDGYGLLASDVVARMHAMGLRVLAFDDFGTDGGGADLVVNQNRPPSAKMSGIAASRLLGPQYALVDPTYASHRDKSVAGSIERIVLTFGGSDQHGLTDRAVAALACVPGAFYLDVVIGPYHRVREFAPPGRHRLAVHQKPNGLASLFGTADLAISAAGTTCWQICCVGVPLIAVQTVDNQREAVRCLAEQGCAITQDRETFCQALEDGELPVLLAKLAGPAVRGAMVAAQRRLVDGNGAARIAAAMGL